MPSIENDKEMLYRISCEKYTDESREIYLKERKKESYYVIPDIKPCEYLQNYEFQTVEELKGVLEKLFIEKELPIEYMMPALVMALKLKEVKGDKEVLMESIYNF